MTVQDFITIWQAQPFRAFRMYTTRGEFDVNYPMGAALTHDMRVAVIVDDTRAETFALGEIKRCEAFGHPMSIVEVMGAIPYEVNWESLADDAEALNFIDNISCHRLNMALRGICQDDMGKEAVREGLKKIRLKNVKDKAAMQISFRDGVLEMHCAYALRTEGMFSDTDIRQVLEKGL